MRNHPQLRCQLMLVVFAAFIFFSCNDSSEVPFPEKELDYSQPVTVPISFGEIKKLQWDTVKVNGIHPVVKKLDLDALPSVPYDTAGYRPLAKSSESRIDFNSLPEAPFSLDSLSTTSLDFKTSLLPPPLIIKSAGPSPQIGKPLSIFDFGQQQGLPAKFITSLLRDKDGLMWIATIQGLFRYDGEHVRRFITWSNTSLVAGMVQDNEGRIWYVQQAGIGMIDVQAGISYYSKKIASVPDNMGKMLKDASGRIWVFNSVDKAVSIIDPKTRTFKNFNKKAGLSDTLAFEVTEDHFKRIWISTYHRGITIVDPAGGKIKYLDRANGLHSDSLAAITTDEKGQVWIAAQNGNLDAVDIKNGVIIHYDTPLQEYQTNFTICLHAEKNGNIWVGTTSGLKILDPASNTIKIMSQAQGLAGKIVTTILSDRLGSVWISALSGINIIRQNAALVHPLGTTVAITMMEDSLGNRWIGTDKGIAIIDPKKNLIRFLNKSNGLSNDFIQSFAKSGEQIWVTSNGGLDIIDLSRKTIEHAGKAEGLVKDTVYAVFKDREENTWLTGPANGIDLIDPQKKLLRHTGPGKGLSDNNITDIREDNNGQVWLATGKSGVDIVDLAKGIVKNLRQLPGLKDTCTKMMLLDKEGRMWIGTDRGLYVTDARQETLTAISTREGLSNNRVWSLWECKGSVVAATSTRINIITAPWNNPGAKAGDTSSRQWTITTVDQSEGLFRQQANAWNTDIITENGEYWWGDRGITVIKEIVPAGDSVPNYITGMNIMTQPRFFTNDYKNLPADTIWTADTFYLEGKIPLGAGYAANDKLKWDKVSGPFNMPENLQVPYNLNYMQFQFARAHMGRQDTASYTYVLEGIDKKWSAPTTNLYTENYLNLSPGKYTFKVSSKGIDGRWSKPAVFSFAIAPPWYNTWWAYTLMALAAIGLLRFYIVYRSRRLKKENSLLEEKVNLRTNQLQQSLEDLRATQSQLIQSEKMASLGELTAGIAHEIQNPLNFVNNFSEVNTELIVEMKYEIEKGNLEDAKAIADDIAANEQKISQHGKRADAIVKGMLQHSRSSSGIKESTDINTLADEYLRLAYHGLRAKDKSFNATLKTDFDKNAGAINIIPQDIGRVILNLITNAFYAVTEKKKMEQTNTAGSTENPVKTYEPTVTVSTKKTGDRMEIRVKDNGNGIPQKVLEKIFQPFFTTKPTGQGTGLGLSMSYDIITKGHGGELSVVTKEGEGAEFIIQLPLA